MAVKKISVTQKVNLNGTMVSRSFVVPAENAAAIDGLISCLEGEVTVKEEVKKIGTASTNVTTANFIKLIKMNAESGSGLQPVYVAPFGGGSLVFKNSKSNDDIRNALITLTPFVKDPVAKPHYISIHDGERVNDTTPAG